MLLGCPGRRALRLVAPSSPGVAAAPGAGRLREALPVSVPGAAMYTSQCVYGENLTKH